MLGYQRWTDELCSDCGQPGEECLDADAFEGYDAEPWQCQACAAREQAAKRPDFREMPGVKWVVRLREPVRLKLMEKRRTGG